MAGDDLNTPLGQGKRPWSVRSRRTAVTALAGVALVAILGAAAVLGLADQHGGEPFAVAPIAPPQPVVAAAEDRLATGSIHASGAMPPGSRSNAMSPLTVGLPAPAPGDANRATGSVENGVTVYRASRPAEAHDGLPGATGPLVIKVPDALGQSEVLPVDRRLVEETRYGPLPKIAADGARASDVYARPPVFAGTIRPGAPRIAILVGGLGLSRAATQAAIDRMPAAVSLAFAPYGDALDAMVQRAKANGHEVLLQLPMEGFGEAHETPGPHTLAVAASSRETIDDMHWLMSRMGGYVGVANFLGGRLTADKVAMTTVLQEIGARGLLYVDDGTSARSLASALAPSLGVAAARVDVVLDGNPAAIRAGLLRLEAVARDKGLAIGMATDQPDQLDPIAGFAGTLEAKGIALVPVSALASAAAPAMAATP